MKKTVVIEIQDENGVEWGVSFDGPNPEADKYVQCASKDDAFRLKRLIEE